MRYKIIIEYDGSDYVGWQSQIDQPNKSIEEILTNAIFNLTQETVKLNCAGRTDSGVHAIAQVADFELSKPFETFRILMGLNHNLSQTNISIISCEEVNDDFHSRYNAKSRSYRYEILNRRAPPAIEKHRVFHVPTKLDIASMILASKHLIGTHDFSSFRDAKCQALSPIKTIDSIDFKVLGEKIIIEIRAKSFLHHMVRNIVGTLVLVGQNKISASSLPKIISSKDRSLSGPNAPAHGLYFLGAKY